MSGKARWFELPVQAPVLVAVEIPADVPDDHAEAYAVEMVCKDGVEWYPCCSAKPVAEGVACVEGERFHQVFPLAPIAPSKDWNTDGDVKADKLTGGGR